MKECAGAVGTLADKRSEGSQMDETLKLRWLCCPRCGGKTRTQIRTHTVLEDFPLFCPKCKYTCVIRFKDGKMGNQNARRLDAVQTEKIGLYCAFLFDLWR